MYGLAFKVATVSFKLSSMELVAFGGSVISLFAPNARARTEAVDFMN